MNTGYCSRDLREVGRVPRGLLRIVIAALIVLGLSVSALADEKKIDKEKVLQELELPKIGLRLHWEISRSAGLKKPEDYWTPEMKIEKLKEKISSLEAKKPLQERAELYYSLGNLMMDTKKEDKGKEFLNLAIKEYETLLKEDKKNTRLLFGLSASLEAIGKKEEARNQLLSIIEIDPDFYEAYSALLPSFPLKTAAEEAEFDKWRKIGEKYFEEGFKKGKSDAKFYESYFSFYMEARLTEFSLRLQKEKDLTSAQMLALKLPKYAASEKSLEIVKKAIGLNPESALYHIWLGSLYLAGPADYWANKGFDLSKTAKKELSDKEEVKMLKDISKEVLKVKSEEMKAAEEHLLFAYKKGAFEYTQLFQNLAFLQLLKWDWQKAEEFLLQAIRSHPREELFYSSLLMFYVMFLEDDKKVQDEKMDAMVRLLEERNKTDPSPEIYSLIGKIKYRKDNLDGAKKAFDSALAISPDDLWANLAKVVVLLKSNNLKDAGSVLEHMKEIEPPQHPDPDNVILYCLTGAIYSILTGDYDGARVVLNAVTQIAPENESAKKLLGMLNEK